MILNLLMVIEQDLVLVLDTDLLELVKKLKGDKVETRLQEVLEV